MKNALRLFFAAAFLFAVRADAQQNYFTFTFDSPVAISDSNNAGSYYEVPNAWYPDRYPPHAFEQYSFNGRNVLRQSISIADDLINRQPPSSRNTFHNWQGRKYDLAKANGDHTALTADLYIPSGWQTSHRSASLWATCFSNTDSVDGIYYPTFGFRNTTTTNPGFYILNNNTGAWDLVNVSIAYDTWYTLQFSLTDTLIQYYLNGTLVRTDSGVGGANYFGNMMLQAYNFGDSTLAAASQAYESYDVYWDNVGVLNTNDVPLPVELLSFTAAAHNASVLLIWKTATEKNNYGFSIERRTAGTAAWKTVGFVAGNGTTNTAHSYSYTDASASSGSYIYRLQQIDNNGSSRYSNEAEIVYGAPNAFALGQNYPNPFNPATVISYQIPSSGWVTLKVYDILGKEIATLVNEAKDAGSYRAAFHGNNLASGVYFYKLQAGAFSAIKKLMLLK